MFPSTTSSTPLLFQDFLSKFHSRRLLLDTPLHHSSPDTAASPSMVIGRGSPEFYPGENSFDANIVMVLSVLLCAIICALGLNSVIRCALRCSSQVTSESGHNIANRLSNTGVKKKTLNTFSILAYSSELKLPGLDTMCAICLSEFSPGEGVRVLPNCNHGFHIGCIDKWLMSHTSCPTCRHCLIKTCKKKIASCSQASSSETTPPLQGGIVPLEPEELSDSCQQRQELSLSLIVASWNLEDDRTAGEEPRARGQEKST